MTLTSCISSYGAHVAHIISCPPTLLPTQFTKDKKITRPFCPFDPQSQRCQLSNILITPVKTPHRPGAPLCQHTLTMFWE